MPHLIKNNERKTSISRSRHSTSMRPIESSAERIAPPHEPESAEPVIHSAKSIGKLANLAHSKSAVRSSNVRKNS